MKSKTVMAFFVFGVVAILGTGLVMASKGASTGSDFKNFEGRHGQISGEFNHTEDRLNLMNMSFDDLDYNSWLELVTEEGKHSKVLDFVTEENFETYVAMHNAMLEGDFELASELRTELGLPIGKMGGERMKGVQRSFGSQTDSSE